MKLWLH